MTLKQNVRRNVRLRLLHTCVHLGRGREGRKGGEEEDGGEEGVGKFVCNTFHVCS